MNDDPGALECAPAAREGRRPTEGLLTRSLGLPGRLVPLLVAVQLLLWGVLSGYLDPAPPTDSLEQILFSQELRPFYVKHPALPTWVLYAVNRVFGPSVLSTFMLGALCAALTLVLLYAWACKLVGAPRAALATLLASTIVFLNVGSIQYSNNTVQLPLAMLSIILFHRALTRGGWATWALLGAAAGLMALAKLSALVLFASFAIYLLWSGRLHRLATLRWIAVAALVFGVVLAPALIAANNVDPAAEHYMRQMMFPPEVSRAVRLLSVWDFSMAQLAAVAPALLAFMLIRRSAPSAAPATDQPVPLAGFVTIVGFGPFIITVAAAVLSGARLLSGWGTTFHLLLPLWLVAASRFSVDVPRPMLIRAAAVCFGVQALLWIAMMGNGGALPNLYSKAQRSAPLAPPQLADAVRRAWSAKTTVPLRYVVADIRTGAALAVAFSGSPRVVDGNRPDFTRAFTPSMQAACGFVAVTLRPPVRDRNAPNYDPLDDALNATASLEEVAFEVAGGQDRSYFIGVRPPSGQKQCDDVDPAHGTEHDL